MVVCALLSRQHRTARGGFGATASAPAPTTANIDFGHIAEATDHKPNQFNAETKTLSSYGRLREDCIHRLWPQTTGVKNIGRTHITDQDNNMT